VSVCVVSPNRIQGMKQCFGNEKRNIGNIGYISYTLDIRFSLRRQLKVPGSDNKYFGRRLPTFGRKAVELQDYTVLHPCGQLFKSKLRLNILHLHGNMCNSIPRYKPYERKYITCNGVVSSRLWRRNFRLYFSIRNVLCINYH
jgi:hypothetical protein